MEVNGYEADGEFLQRSATVPIKSTNQTVNDRLVLSWTNPDFSLQSAPAITGTSTT
jgi:hypothetical protein